MNELDIKAPEGYEIDQENSDLSTGKIRFKQVPSCDCKELSKSGLAKSWEELGVIKGCYVTNQSNIMQLDHGDSRFGGIDKNLWATEEQAEASIAMAMLSQLMKQANGDWTPDWSKGNQIKYTIANKYDKLCEDYQFGFSAFLAFKSEEIRDEFLELHRDLIEKAKPLL